MEIAIAWELLAVLLVSTFVFTFVISYVCLTVWNAVQFLLHKH
jgi:hypothetical protein